MKISRKLTQSLKSATQPIRDASASPALSLVCRVAHASVLIVALTPIRFQHSWTYCTIAELVAFWLKENSKPGTSVNLMSPVSRLPV